MSTIKLYTKKGDKGMTSLYDGTRVSKTDLHMDVLGTLDELNVHVGTLASMTGINFTELRLMQLNLIDISSVIATPKKRNRVKGFDSSMIKDIERLIDDLQQAAPPLREFILPCTNNHNSQAHLCRVVARRAERELLKLYARFDEDQIDKNIQIYMNRLSDYFFAVARVLGPDISVSQFRNSDIAVQIS